MPVSDGFSSTEAFRRVALYFCIGIPLLILGIFSRGAIAVGGAVVTALGLMFLVIGWRAKREGR